MYENSLSFTVDTTVQRGLVGVEVYNENGKIEFSELGDVFPALPFDKNTGKLFFVVKMIESFQVLSTMF